MNNELRSALRQAYDGQAARRNASPKQAWKQSERQAFLSLLQQEGKQTLLELGSGTGQDAAFFQDEGLAVTCIDLSPEMVRFCQEKGLTAHVMDFGALDFPADSFDAVYALNSLLHLPKAELPGVLRNVHTVLAADGLFFLGVYGGFDHEGVWADDSHEPKRFFSFFTDAHLARTVRKVFDIVSFTPVQVSGGAGNLHFQAVVLQKRQRSPAC